MTRHRVVVGDSRRMAEVTDESVHLVVTSPPYWQLKDYGPKQQIGYHDSYESYINNLNLVWKECHRVLHPGCRLCINIGDQFARAAYYGRYKVIPIRTEITRFCEAVGFDYMGAIIWQKVTTCNTSGGATVMGSFPYPRNGVVKLDYEFVLLFKKRGRAPRVSREVKEQSRLSREEWNEYFYGHWNFSGEKQKKHLAAFPLELPRRIIKMFSFVGDVILDPFLGSGTTTLAALQLARDSIGYEINEDYAPVIDQRLQKEIPATSGGARLEIVPQPADERGFEEDLRLLPYRFEDPVPFERRADPKCRSYGSRIDGTNVPRPEYHRVKRVVSPSDLVLDTGEPVRLTGIEPDGENDAAAVALLEDMTRGQKVFLRPEASGGHSGGSRAVYLYLKNKTFVNARLIRSGLVEVDTTSEYTARTKFVALRDVGRTETRRTPDGYANEAGDVLKPRASGRRKARDR